MRTCHIYHESPDFGRCYLVDLYGQRQTWPSAEAAQQQIQYLYMTRGWGTNAPSVQWVIEYL